MIDRLKEVIQTVETFDQMTPEEKDAIMKGIRACDVIGVVGMACLYFSTRPEKGDSASWEFIHRLMMVVADMTERVENGEALPEAHMLQTMLAEMQAASMGKPSNTSH